MIPIGGFSCGYLEILMIFDAALQSFIPAGTAEILIDHSKQGFWLATHGRSLI